MTKSIDLETRDGINQFDDHLGDVASQAAVELDFIRLGRPKGDWAVRVLAGWLLKVARGDAPLSHSAELFLCRMAKRTGRDLGGTDLRAVRAFADGAGSALFQAIHFDPTPNGWRRHDVLTLCLDISRYACADQSYGRSGRNPAGQWRGINWWQPA